MLTPPEVVGGGTVFLAALKMAFLAGAPDSFSSGLVGGEFQNATVVPTTEQKEFSDLQNNNNNTTMVYWNDTAQKTGSDYSPHVPH